MSRTGEGGAEGVMRVPQDLEKMCLRRGMRRGDGGRRREELKKYITEASVVVGVGYGELPVGIHGVSRGGRRGGAPLRDRDIVLVLVDAMVIELDWNAKRKGLKVDQSGLNG
ncbi:hypothetical protein BJ165DRAFT_1406961 [Panaeolus papilionaceus]|nr:hypothetical protein BJ165DRAFT_1406961 [Panaeolus papilionaceus]